MDHGAEDTIRERAYALWEKEGCPDGRELEFWDRARLMLEAESQPAPTTPLQLRSEAEKVEDEAGKGTFPASDPPSFTADKGVRQR